MIFTPTEALPDVHRVDLDRREDNRGFFARIWCADELAAEGLCPRIAQINLSFTARRGTVRGIHFQRGEGAEERVVRCVRGAVLDIAVDLRAGSPTFGRWTAARLDAENRTALYIPKGFGHAFQALTDDVEMVYIHSTPYRPDLLGGVRFDDPDVAIDWPLPPVEISDRDLALPLLAATEPAL